MNKKFFNKFIQISLIIPIFFNFLDLKASDKLSKISGKSEIKAIQKQAYILGPGDEIKMILEGSPEFSGIYEIVSDGTISLPYIKNITLTGETISSAIDIIENQLSTQYINPNISISISYHYLYTKSHPNYFIYA